MTHRLETRSPVDGRIYVERPLASESAIADALASVRRAARAWRAVSVEERAARCSALVDAFVARRAAIAEEITWQMGRPIAQSPGEVGGFEERARKMIELAGPALADRARPERSGFRRFIRPEPLGVVLVIAPWNYPYLTAVNTVVPALVAGNGVLLRHSAQTPLCAERMVEAGREAGLPEGLFAYLHTSHADTERLVASPEVDFVAFTGGVAAGRRVQQAAAERSIDVGFELGGKDPGYVRADADVAAAAAGLMDGAFFNAGQSCCGIERVYVHADVHDAFCEAAVAEAHALRLGDPTDPATSLGPMVNASAAAFVRGQVKEAIAAGARALVDERAFEAATPDGPYCAPQILTEVDHSMRVMTEESFGPVVGIQRVASDEEAIDHMNDSAFGLTACVYTRDAEAAAAIGARVETGTFFMNRCDYLDPELAWVGAKDSGQGCTLSELGYGQLTRPKSFHLRL